MDERMDKLLIDGQPSVASFQGFNLSGLLLHPCKGPPGDFVSMRDNTMWMWQTLVSIIFTLVK